MISSLDRRIFIEAVGFDRIGKQSEIDIEARCPICGDSKHNKNKKRLHLYQKDNVTLVNCFNGDCPCQNKTVYNFLKTFYPNLLFKYKREKFLENINTQESFDEKLNREFKNSFSKINTENLDNRKENIQTKPFKTQDLSRYFIDLKQSLDGLKYIKSRGFKTLYNELGKWYFSKNDLIINDKKYRIKNAIIIPLYYNDEMYGFYSRNIFEKTFYTYVDPSAVGYKVWNWFNIEKEKPVYIFEGIFDALSAYACGIKNVIACMGAKLPNDRLNELKEPIFCLDNDKTGLKNMIAYSKKYQVCAFKSKYKDFNEMYQNNLNISELIKNNISSGIVAEVKIRQLL